MADGVKVIANNKKAYFDYFILDKYETGIELFGTEVKSIRLGQCSIKESWIRIERGELYIMGMHINPYEKGNIFKLSSKLQEKGLTLVPLQVYLKGRLVKVEIGMARGKKNYDKRDTMAKKDQKREMDKALKQRMRDV